MAAEDRVADTGHAKFCTEECLMIKKKPMKRPESRTHPSGPGLPGHPVCPKGMIWDHASGHCIPLAARKSKRKKPYNSGGGGMDMYG